jgi:hypothetical protein
MRQRSFTPAQKGAAKAAPQGAWDIDEDFLLGASDDDIADMIKDILGQATVTEALS